VPHFEPLPDPHAGRYTRTAIALHWLIAVAIIVQFCWGWWMQGIPKQPPGMRVDAYNLHKSIGLTLLALMAVRLLWRWRHPAPAFPAMPRWQARMAHIVHALLYAVLFVHPLSGYLGSVFSGYPVKLFGMTLPAWGWNDPVLKQFFSASHRVTSWVLLAAVALHVAGALKHALVDRDGLLSRMGIGKGLQGRGLTAPSPPR
jgi:cytochrome b561